MLSLNDLLGIGSRIRTLSAVVAFRETHSSRDETKLEGF